jgi:hypothetical protein
LRRGVFEKHLPEALATIVGVLVVISALVGFANRTVNWFNGNQP